MVDDCGTQSRRNSASVYRKAVCMKARGQNTTSVLVVGGSVVGLSTAVFLAWKGVPTVVVEKHPGSSKHPRARGFTPRTMELFRAVGLGDRVPQVPPALASSRPIRTRIESLAGKWHEET